MTNGPIEPPADMRQTATAMHQLFIAYVDAGFTEPQALELLKALLPKPPEAT